MAKREKPMRRTTISTQLEHCIVGSIIVHDESGYLDGDTACATDVRSMEHRYNLSVESQPQAAMCPYCTSASAAYNIHTYKHTYSECVACMRGFPMYDVQQCCHQQPTRYSAATASLDSPPWAAAMMRAACRERATTPSPS